MSVIHTRQDDPSDGKQQMQWIPIRESWTKRAIDEGDFKALRKISALPGGFGGEEIRKKAWSKLLRTHLLAGEAAGPVITKQNPDEQALPEEDKASSPHPQKENEEDELPEAGPSEPKPYPNERQVKLDTDRSFVTYPKGIPSRSKIELQADLNHLIVGVLRKYPALNYFQGYHDILSVLYLTFIPPRPTPPRSRSSSRNRIRKERSHQQTPEALTTPVENDTKSHEEKSPPPAYEAISRDTSDWRELRKCAEMVSLNRVRDAMGSGMEGMMGLLRILKRILKAADPELSQFSAKISPVPTLPFFALSWVLTLFSHDCDSLQPIQRMFDFLLARNPISAVYLAASILILKKPQIFEIAHQLGAEYEDDPTLLHPLFVRLPPLYADTPSEPDPPPVSPTPTPTFDELQDDSLNPYKPIKLSVLFQLTDTLMDKYPWDGHAIRGKEIMGEGSVVNTYSKEENEEEWNAEEMLKMIDVQVVMRGAGDISEDEEEIQPVKEKRRRVTIRNPRNNVNTILALGIVVLGVGIAVYGFKAGGSQASWGRWWGMVIRGWIGREGRGLEGTIWRGIGWVRKALRDVL
uniref:Rab-GAP TBC domain-containing protein n=1 Tax=Kwoniella bestiolae CBS 10118 TaxID=1296100 RepID=A0A1B9G787_9TREE|nr:hypothetical protein I302_04551 [Kwoniella bestiolae CBS 10118]OCF26861.1 hypothetical protein I302_04551 [Kwoniella bestiolae CBS 10118]